MSISFIQKWLPYLILVLTLAFYPLLGTFLANLGIVNTTPIAIGYRAVYLGLSLLSIFIYLPVLHRIKIPLVVICFLFFWTIYTGRIVNDFVFEGVSRGYTKKGALFFLTYGLGGCLAPAIAVALSANLINYYRLQKLLLVFFGLCALSIFAFLVKENGLSMDVLGYRLRVGDSVVSPIAVSQYGGALFISSASFWLLLQKKNWFLPIGILIGIILLVLGSSRGPLLAGGVTLLFILLDHFRARAKKVTYWLSTGLIVSVLIMAVVKFVVPILDQISLFSRITKTINEGSGLDVRGQQWSAAWQQFLDNPILGDALVESAHNFYPHNMQLEILMSTGIIGMLSLLPAFVGAFRRFYIRHFYSPEQRITFYLLIFFSICAIFSLALITLTHVWVLWALAASFTLPDRRGDFSGVSADLPSGIR